jgi:hypothetical protein
VSRKRPFGVRVVILLLVVLGVVIATEARRRNLALPWAFPERLLPQEPAVQVLGYAVAALLVFLAGGMWLLRRYAWVGTMLLVGVLMAIELLWYAKGAPRYLIMTLCVLIVFYLNQSEVQGLFRGRADRAP